MLGAAAIVVHFDLLPDRDGLVRQPGGVEAAQLGVVAAVDDGHGGHAFFAQAGDGVDVVPVCGCGRAGSCGVSSLNWDEAAERGRTYGAVAVVLCCSVFVGGLDRSI